MLVQMLINVNCTVDIKEDIVCTGLRKKEDIFDTVARMANEESNSVFILPNSTGKESFCNFLRIKFHSY